MEKGIIASFKARYRRCFLQHAVDMDEQGELNIYKVNQLQAMRWSKWRWNEISSKVANSIE